jgi:hypothetical protein
MRLPIALLSMIQLLTAFQSAFSRNSDQDFTLYQTRREQARYIWANVIPSLGCCGVLRWLRGKWVQALHAGEFDTVCQCVISISPLARH